MFRPPILSEGVYIRAEYTLANKHTEGKTWTLNNGATHPNELKAFGCLLLRINSRETSLIVCC